MQVRVSGSSTRVRTVGGGGFFRGVGFLGQGLAMYGRHPRLMLLGLIPALLSFALLVVAFFAMLNNVDRVVEWLTPFLDGWWLLADVLRFVVKIIVIILWAILSILGFVALTLLIGQPFYEAISKRVEDHLGGVKGEINVSFWKSLPRTIIDSVRLGIRAVLTSIVLFLVGLIPVIGWVSAVVLGCLLGGWVLVLELTSVPFERRGLFYGTRKGVLRANRRMSLGFGAATFLCFLIPVGAVIFMPAAVAGATLLSRQILTATPR